MTSWETLQQQEFQKPYFKALKNFLTKEIKAGQTIYPPPHNFFKAFDLCTWAKTKVVIIGQDPYHGPDQAQGLSFSVPKPKPIPPSLKNIFKELQQDLNQAMPAHGNLESWAQQGVLLLNSTLSVRASSPGSHFGQGWEVFTDQMIEKLSQEKRNLVFMLWGKPAQTKEKLINPAKHLILKAAHPSPFSAHNGFFGCRHFSKANDYLIKQDKKPINWTIEN